jgi:hypothetical protein
MKDHRRRKKFKKSWIVLGLLCLGVLFFHKPLLLIGCKATLHRLHFTYEKMQWKDGAIAVSGLQSKSLTIDQIELKLAGSFLKFEPKITISHPQLLVSLEEEQHHSLPFLYRSRFIEPHWEINNGVLQLPTGGRFYFSMAPGSEAESIGHLVFSSDPDPRIPPMFTADLAQVDKSLQVGFQLQESDLGRLLPLSALIFPKTPRAWERAGGEVQLEGLVYFDKSLKIQELHFQGEGREILFSAPTMGIDVQCDELLGKFSCSAEDRLIASVQVKNGNFLIGAPFVQQQFRIEGLDGALNFEPHKEPELVLSGALLHEDRRLAFDCLGKGGIREDKSCWSEIAMNCEGMQAALLICGQSSGDLSLHLQVEGAGAEQIEFFRILAQLPGKCLEANASFAATFFYKDECWQKMSVENCRIENFHWAIPEENATLYFKELLADCTLTAPRTLQNLHLQGENGEFSLPNFDLNTLSANIQIRDSVLQPSQIKGKSRGLRGEIAFLGPEANHFADMKIQGDVELEGIDAMPVDLSLEVETDSVSLKLLAAGTFCNEPIQGAALFSHTGEFPFFTFKEATLQGDLTATSYSPFLARLLPEIGVTGNLQCAAAITPEQVQIEIAGNAISIQHSLALLEIPVLTEKKMQFSYDCAKKQWRGEIPFDGGKLNYRERNLPFENLEGSFKLDANRLTASSFYAECEGVALRGDLLLENGLELSLATSQMAGSVENLFSVLKHFPSLASIALPVEGEFSGGKNGFALKTSMQSSETTHWNFKGHFSHLKFPINAYTSINDGRCDLSFESNRQLLTLEKGEGMWRLIDGTPLTFQLKQFSSEFADTPRLAFAFKILDGRKEFAHFEGAASRNTSSEWEIAFNRETTFFGGTQLNITRCSFDDQMKLASFEMQPVLKCQELHLNAAFLQNAGFLSKTFSPKNLQEWQFEGTLQTRLFSESAEKGFSFHAQSRDLKVRGKPWPSFQLKAHKVGDNWLIEHLEGGGLTLKGAFIVEKEELSIRQFEGKWQGIDLKGSGRYRFDSRQYFCTFESIKGDLAALAQFDPTNTLASLKGDFAAGVALVGNGPQFSGELNFFVDLHAPFSLSARNKSAIAFVYGPNGLICQEIDLQFKDKNSGAYIAELKAKSLTPTKIEQLQFSLNPVISKKCLDAKLLPDALKDLTWEGNLEGSGEWHFGTFFQATLTPGRYGFVGKEFNFEQLQLRSEKKLLTLRGKIQIEENPLWAALQLDLSKEPCGALKLCDHPKADGLKISFRMNSGKPSFETVQGQCYGIQCSLEKNEKRKAPLGTVLTGSIALDANLLRPLLPKTLKGPLESLKMGNGYRWQGDLVLWQDSKRGYQASGILSGHEFEFLGYQFRNLQANLEASPEQLFLSELKIDDPAGSIAIQKMQLSKTEKWRLHIPQVLVRNLQPSLMHKIGGENQPVKPFTIKNFTLSDIHGDLGDISSLEGLGKLHFVNQFKKEASIFDVPLDMLKKIGLDPGILTPVQGEIELELRGDKFYLMSLQNAFSEGGRAEFYLAPTKQLSYIDLDGKIHIDLKMHQDVMLKITEPFTLTIRGSLEKPRYGLQY